MEPNFNKILIISTNHFPQDITLKNVALRLLNEGNRVTICEFASPLGNGKKIKEEIKGITIYRASPFKRINDLKSILGSAREIWIVETFFRTLKEFQHFLSKLKLFTFSAYIAFKNGFDLLIIPPKSHLKIARFYKIMGKQIKTFHALPNQSPKRVKNSTAKLEALWLKLERKQPMHPKDRATLIKGVGIKNNVAGKKRQVTIIQQEAWEGLMNELGLSLDPSTRRANLMICGLELANQRNRVLRVGSCRLLVIDETKPCKRMDEAWDGLCSAMINNWVGGSYAEVLDDGEINLGDKVSWED